MDVDAGDDDLYGDLDAAVDNAENARLKESLADADKETRAVKERLAEAEKEVARLRAANETLERNISVLFNTALAEIGRKDREIERLQRSAGR